jgi:hypothetical protein
MDRDIATTADIYTTTMRTTRRTTTINSSRTLMHAGYFYQQHRSEVLTFGASHKQSRSYSSVHPRTYLSLLFLSYLATLCPDGFLEHERTEIFRYMLTKYLPTKACTQEGGRSYIKRGGGIAPKPPNSDKFLTNWSGNRRSAGTEKSAAEKQNNIVHQQSLPK